ncbi:hypothetical protein [Aeromonas veronii]|uniref:hypothetical protein n=1 Tax=Aeromonas veronii TaxID=654 RepID=UPI00111A0885|nr:hypothetical protein [Aeromonas veronii]TNJ11407.1 hypothetical protein CF107_08835 [Aeromonas veronii]
MAIVKSYFIENASVGMKTEFSNARSFDLPMDVNQRYCVFKTFVDKKVVYCCWSSGRIENNQPKLTAVGSAALEALCELPSTDKKTLIFQEIKAGKTPVKSKVRKALKKAPRNACICFIGDFDKTLDGNMIPALNVVGVTEL